MASLQSWMRSEGVTDDALADEIGGVSAEHIRKIKLSYRGASMRVAARIFDITGGAVRPPDLVPSKRRSSVEARP